MPSDPRGVYIDELSSLFYGYPILNPRRASLKFGRGLRPAIAIGDVAYDCDGQLIRLFNCCKSRAQQDEGTVLPEGFEPLRLAVAGGPITINRTTHHPGRPWPVLLAWRAERGK